MSYLVALDPGHDLVQTKGKHTPIIPELNRRIKEHEFNRAVVNLMKPELERHGFKVLVVAPNPKFDTALSARTNVANKHKADIYVSVHYNAGGGQGLETFYHRYSAKGKRLAQIVHKHLIATSLRKDRGLKTNNFHVTRETRMPAILIEYGFMDDPGLVEARQMLDKNIQKQFATATAKGICEYFGVEYKSTVQKPSVSKELPFYDVVVNGSNKAILSARNVNELTSFLSDQINKGVDSITFNKRK